MGIIAGMAPPVHLIQIAPTSLGWRATLQSIGGAVIGEGFTPQAAIARVKKSLTPGKVSQESPLGMANDSSPEQVALAAAQAVCDEIDSLSDLLETDLHETPLALHVVGFKELSPGAEAGMGVVIDDGSGTFILADLSLGEAGCFELGQAAPGYSSAEAAIEDLAEWHSGVTWR